MLQAYKLTKRYGSNVALCDVSFHVGRGETLVVMGPSGCGKSTLLRSLNRLIQVDSGEIWFDGESVMDYEEQELLAYRRKIGFVFQQFNLMAHLSALENCLLGPSVAGVPRTVALEKAHGALARVGLLERKDARPSAMSGGERQRVAIARALAMEPELILWDEPTAALDPIMVEEVLSIMGELATQRETAMVVVTHEIPFALAVADRLVMMDAGRIVAEGEPRHVLFESTCDVATKYRRLYELRYTGSLPFQEPASQPGRNGRQAPRSDRHQLFRGTAPSRAELPVSGVQIPTRSRKVLPT